VALRKKDRNLVFMIEDVPIQVERKYIRNMYLRVREDGTVHLSAPARLTDREITAFARERLPWIRKQQKTYRKMPKRQPAAYRNGSELYLWGLPHTFLLKETGAGKSDVRADAGLIVLSVPQGTTEAQREKIMDVWYYNELARVLPELVGRWETATGLSAREYQLRKMKTRWGSCSVEAKRIWLNTELVKYPPECLEYVMVHELCHLVERSHNKRFWELVGSFYPNWKAARKLLSE